jgi:hypothetical protein
MTMKSVVHPDPEPAPCLVSCDAHLHGWRTYKSDTNHDTVKNYTRLKQ